VAVVSIIISSRLSREALAASDRQSRDAIEAIQKQIDASEKQTKDTIEAVNRQIEASERQAQEALYNQHKPIVIPISNLSSKDIILKQQYNLKFIIGLQNKGAGVALNTLAITAVEGLPEVFCSTSTWILSQDADMPKGFDFNAGIKHIYPSNEFEGVSVFPQGVFGFARLMVTYSDIFDNRYFGVFDYSEEFGWRLKDEIKRVEKRLDELVIIKH
jgi:predicted dinucleotide-utilizing enzyme